MKNANDVIAHYALSLVIICFCISLGEAQTNSNSSEGGLLKLNELEADTITYRAKSIESRQKINNKSKVKYLAKDRITLDKDFSIRENVQFRVGVVKECGTLEEKVEPLRMEILKNIKNRDVRLKVLEALLPKTEENKTSDNLPRYNYLINYGDGNYKIFKSQDNFDRITNHTYDESGIYNLKGIRVKLPPKEPDDEDERMGNLDFDLVHLVEETVEIDEQSEPSSAIDRTTIKDNVEITFFPEKPISGELFTIISSFKSEESVDSSQKAILSFDSDSLIEGIMDIYYGDTEGTESCEDDFIVNVSNIKKNTQRNFFSYFKINPELKKGDSVKICLNYQMYDTCRVAKIGNPHDPSFKRLLNNAQCPKNDSLNFLIHIENDGDALTDTIKVYDYFDPPLPCLKIEEVIMSEEDKITKCQKYEIDSFYVNPYKTYETAGHFEFDGLVLRGQNETGYPIDPQYEDTKDEFTFTLKLEQPILDPTYWCNKADIVFNDEDPYTIETCFYCYGKNYELLNGSPPPTKEFFIKNDTVKIRPTFFKENLFTTANSQTITIMPDLSELPNEVDEDDLEYIWWPKQETTPTITVSPTQNTNYRLRVSWMQNDTMCFATDYVFVETRCFYGCTNSEVENYDSLAVCDDGSCRYCIEESDSTLFTTFDWLNEKVDKDNCNAESIKITHYKRQGTYNFIGIEIEGVVNYYRESGNYLNYTEDEIKKDFLNRQYSICTWECEGKKRTLCETYPWLSNFYNNSIIGAGPVTINGGTTITINSNSASIIQSYKYYNNNILYIVDYLENGIVYIDFDSDSQGVVPFYTDTGKKEIIYSLINDGYDIVSQKSWQCQTINCQ